MDAIEISGARYVRATDAARTVGYTTDYVGQLSRGGKIEARRIGRVWYVKEEDILAHKKGKGRSNKQKTQKEFQKTKAEAEIGQIHHVLYDPNGAPEFRKRLLDIDVKYERDESPLLPPTTERRHSVPMAPVPEVEVPVELAVVSEEKKGDEYHIDVNKWEKKPIMQGQLVIEDLGGFDEEEVEPTKEKVVLRKPLYVRKEVVRESSHTSVPERAPLPRRVLHQTPVIPLPSTSRSIGIPFVTALVPLAFLLMVFSFSAMFFERVLVYERGKNITQRPMYETTYGMREVSAVIKAVSDLR